MRNEIRIAKKFCQKAESRFQDGYYIEMPSTSKYAGYRFYVSSYYCSFTKTYIEITKAKNNTYLFTLEKINREPGKRYARLKLSFDELREELAEHSEQFYSDTLPQALVSLKIYANNGSYDAGKVIGHCLCVGGFDNVWFYESDGVRRKINSKGVRILKILEPNEVEPMNMKLKRLNELNNLENDFDKCRVDYMDRFYYETMSRTLTSKGFAAVTEKFKEINSIIDAEAADCRKEGEELRAYFNAFLEKGEESEDNE